MVHLDVTLFFWIELVKKRSKVRIVFLDFFSYFFFLFLNFTWYPVATVFVQKFAHLLSNLYGRGFSIFTSSSLAQSTRS